jgi:hypothetical protein
VIDTQYQEVEAKSKVQLLFIGSTTTVEYMALTRHAPCLAHNKKAAGFSAHGY